jgi:hypothetical protein
MYVALRYLAAAAGFAPHRARRPFGGHGATSNWKTWRMCRHVSKRKVAAKGSNHTAFFSAAGGLPPCAPSTCSYAKWSCGVPKLPLRGDTGVPPCRTLATVEHQMFVLGAGDVHGSKSERPRVPNSEGVTAGALQLAQLGARAGWRQGDQHPSPAQSCHAAARPSPWCTLMRPLTRPHIQVVARPPRRGTFFHYQVARARGLQGSPT